MADKLPLVYVRGYAGSTSGIDKQVDDPFYGFNVGSTHVRVGRRGDPAFYQFESPLLRLMIDENYAVFVQGSQSDYLDRQEDGTVSPASIWIHRFYDISASTWGEQPQEFTLERAAEDLFSLIQKLQVKTGAPRVQLAAHSMGGLICRCLIQKIIPEMGNGHRATDYVDRLFTYGTPHGGINFDVGFGLVERLRDETGVGGADIFGPRRMYQYLTPGVEGDAGPPEDWDARNMPDDDNFPLERVFCLIGTNPQDYGAAFGLSSKAVGAKSDGLVQVENAYIPGANHAFVHRSHSGRYGLVNSEEGYQNLRRFMFGDIKVTAELVDVPKAIREGEGDIFWQAEVQMSIRGLPVVMAERLAAHHCPIDLSRAEKGSADQPVPLVTTFLWSKLVAGNSRMMRYIFHLRLLSLRQRGGVFGFWDHTEQMADFDDLLVIDLETGEEGLCAWAKWNSEIPVSLRDYVPEGEPLTDRNPEAGAWRARVPLPRSANFLGDASVLLTATDRK